MSSKWEHIKINKILYGLLTGRTKWDPDEAEVKEDDKLFYSWASSHTAEREVANAAPIKQKLPENN
jgi:hypothetical protein